MIHRRQVTTGGTLPCSTSSQGALPRYPKCNSMERFPEVLYPSEDTGWAFMLASFPAHSSLRLAKDSPRQG